MQLTKRQLEILNFLARGYSTKQIANICNISLKTVQNHMYAKEETHGHNGLLARLTAPNTIVAVVIALKCGILNLDDIDIINM